MSLGAKCQRPRQGIGPQGVRIPGLDIMPVTVSQEPGLPVNLRAGTGASLSLNPGGPKTPSWQQVKTMVSVHTKDSMNKQALE